MFFYFAVFIIIVLLSILSLQSLYKRLIFSIITAALLVCIAGFKQVGTDRDSEGYALFFNWVAMPLDYFKYYAQYSFSEVGYYLLPSILKNVFNTGITWFFLIIALIAIPLKFKAIWKLTEFQMFSVLIYFCHFFILHDMTQIRQGIASGILLFALPDLKKKNFIRFSLLLCFGTLFHYSTLVFFPFYFLNTRNLNKPVFFSLLIVPEIFYFFKISIINLLSLMHLGILSEKLNIYNELLEYGLFSEINVYNLIVIVQLIFCSFLIWKSDFFQTKNQYSILLIKIYTIGIASWFLFYSTPVISFRVSGYLEIVEVILVPFIIYYVEEKFIAITFVILFGLELLYIDTIHSKILKPYTTIPLFAWGNKPDGQLTQIPDITIKEKYITSKRESNLQNISYPNCYYL